MFIKNIHKNPYFYTAFLFGALVGIWSYGYWLGGLFPLGSNRLLAAVLLIILVAAGGFYFLAERLVMPVVKELPKVSQTWFWISCLLLGTFLYVSIVDFNYLQSRFIYILLPQQKFEIKGEQKNTVNSEDITIQGISTALGEVGYSEMKVKGWKRDEKDSKQLSLGTIPGNQISWMGQAGNKAVILLEKSPAGGIVDISWNGKQTSYDLYSPSKGTLKVTQPFSVPFYAGWVVLGLIMILGFAAWLCIIFALALSASVKVKTNPPGRFDWLWYTLPMVVMWVLYLLVFYPGGMSPDSIDQWGQMVTGRFVDWQPVFHTLTNWLITRVWYSPASIVIVQIIALSGVLGWGLSVIRRAGAPLWMTWLTAIILAISPSDASLSIMLWKDVAFSIAVVALTIFVLEIVLSKGEWLNKRNKWIFLGMILALVTLYRQNGVLVSVGTLAGLLAAFRKYWKKLGLSLGVFLILLGMVTGGLYRLLNVIPINMARYQIVLYNLVAAHQNNGTLFLPIEKELVRKGFPKEQLPYECYRNKDLVLFIEKSPIYRQYLIENTQSLIKLGVNLTLRSPAVTINHFACNGAFVYRMFGLDGDFETAHPSIPQNNYGIVGESLLPESHPFFVWWYWLSTVDKGYNWLVWKSPFWMFIFVSGCIITCIRKKTWIYLLVFLPAYLVVFPLLFISFGQIFRYIFPMYLISILFCGYFWVTALKQD